jgi:carbon starvation protein
VNDPLGGINSLWPLFGISNQLLAAVALSVGTTLIIRVGRARYAWTTLLPLAWLLAVCSAASWQKMFAADPHLGFISHAATTAAAIAAGTMDGARGARLIFNDRVDAVLCGLFLVITWAVVLSSARVWLRSVRSPAPQPVMNTEGIA